MQKVDATVVKETKYIAAWVLLLSVLMEAVFLILRQWNLTVLWGNLLGAGTAVLNFFLMGLGVQNSLKKEDKDAKTAIRLSQLYRNLMLLAVALVGLLVSVFHSWAVIVPLFFPRIAIMFHPFFHKEAE